jgi:hypothetical protein
VGGVAEDDPCLFRRGRGGRDNHGIDDAPMASQARCVEQCPGLGGYLLALWAHLCPSLSLALGRS